MAKRKKCKREFRGRGWHAGCMPRRADGKFKKVTKKTKKSYGKCKSAQPKGKCRKD